MDLGRNAPTRKVRRKKVRGFLSTPDSGRNGPFSSGAAFQALAEPLPILWLHFSAFGAICLFSFNSEVRKENYFHISNSLNGPKLVAQSLLEPNPLFLYFQTPTWRHCSENGGWLAGPSVMHMGKWVGWSPVTLIHHSLSMSPPPAEALPPVSHSLGHLFLSINMTRMRGYE